MFTKSYVYNCVRLLYSFIPDLLLALIDIWHALPKNKSSIQLYSYYLFSGTLYKYSVRNTIIRNVTTLVDIHAYMHRKRERGEGEEEEEEEEKKIKCVCVCVYIYIYMCVCVCVCVCVYACIYGTLGLVHRSTSP